MSSDLEFFQDQPKIRVLRSITNLPIRRRDESSDTDGGFRTPKAKEHKIPAVLTCPPAPRKPRGLVVSCKRKLSEFDFFEVTHRGEVDEFFRSAFETSKEDPKRRCRDLKFESEI